MYPNIIYQPSFYFFKLSLLFYSIMNEKKTKTPHYQLSRFKIFTQILSFLFISRNLFHYFISSNNLNLAFLKWKSSIFLRTLRDHSKDFQPLSKWIKLICSCFHWGRDFEIIDWEIEVNLIDSVKLWDCRWD